MENEAKPAMIILTNGQIQFTGEPVNFGMIMDVREGLLNLVRSQSLVPQIQQGPRTQTDPAVLNELDKQMREPVAE